MKTILHITVASILLTLTSYAIANKPSFKELQDLGEELEKDWYVLLFQQANMSAVLYGYKTREDYYGPEGYERRKVLYLAEIPAKLKQVIFSKQTINPFKVLFPYIYTTKTKKLIKQCSKAPNNFYSNRLFDFRGIQFELDDNPSTTEWYITAPIEACFYAKSHHLNHLQGKFNDTGHDWIVQKKPSGQYRILMESEGQAAITNKKHQAYKQVETFVSNRHIYRQEATKNPNKYCGWGGITWQYQSGNYQPTIVGGLRLACEYHSDEQRIKQEKEIVIPLVLHWLNRYTPEPITINEKEEVIPLQINQYQKQQKMVSSNCTKNNAMHKAAARGDYRFIAQCLKKGEDVNLVDKNGWTPLHSAARNGHAGIIQLLIKYKANINAKDKTGRTATDQANYSQHYNIVNFLKKKGGYVTR